MRWPLWLPLLALGCTAGQPAPTAKVWTVREFIVDHATGKDFGGWQPAELLVRQGEPLKFFPGEQQGGLWGLRLFPAVAEGSPVAYAITDIWRDHPEPWVQPVWIPATGVGNANRVAGVDPVFPVTLDATFYSPFWQAVWLVDPSVEPGRYHTPSEVLSRPDALVRGSLVLCPFIPNDTEVALAAGSDNKPRHPVTGQVVKQWEHAQGFVEAEDGRVERVSYFDLGVDRAPFEGQRLVEAKAYLFVKAGSNLPVAAVLPGAPLKHGFLRRVNVEVGSAAPFVPGDRPEVAALVREAFGEVKPTRADSANFPQYTLRLAQNPECFQSAGFPADCDWLDSAAKVEALPLNRRTVTNVQFAAGVVAP